MTRTAYLLAIGAMTALNAGLAGYTLLELHRTHALQAETDRRVAESRALLRHCLAGEQAAVLEQR